MATTKRSGLPEVWTTHAAKYLVGDNPCLLRVWLPARFRYDKPVGDESKLTAWKTRHTEQLSAAIDRFRSEGWKCTVERYFRVTGSMAILTGKTDLITQKADCRPTIRDVKGGKPEDSDVAQVQIYQYAIPRAWNSSDMQFDGEVIYDSHVVKISPAEAKAIQPKLFALMNRVGAPERPHASPSESACRFCPVPKSDCPERVEKGEEKVDALVSEF